MDLNTVCSAVRQHWGFDSLRPLQREAIESVLAGRDSLVVLPTGGGKSLCFQAPACCLPGVAVVVSPLISLMKDQVDALRTNGIPAAFYNSSLSTHQRRQVVDQLRGGRLKLLYLAPESLLTDTVLQLLQSVKLSLLAIDEAHCISAWGHDFRPEYRGLKVLRERFPQTAIHGYTATATERVRQDICQQLHLRKPEVLVGSYDRPNLVYRVEPRVRGIGQVVETVERHRGESGIIYCISRKDVERMAEALQTLGFRARAYHAGMDDLERHRNQDAFLAEEVDIIVATVAFGMGIDKSNVRYVIHAAAPKSVEAFQQESGRAGRDGLEAECCLFYTGGDFVKWKGLMERAGNTQPGAREALDRLEQFCLTPRCRHQLLVEHFGQTLDQDNCQACDICLGQFDLVADPLVLGQKILSCIARLQGRFGADYTAQVLTGSKEQRVLLNAHDQLSTYALLTDHAQQSVRHWIDQLVGQGFAERVGEYQQLQLTEQGWQVLRGQHTPLLTQPAQHRELRTSRVDRSSWEGVDRGLFEALRELRKAAAAEQQVPAFVVFSDAALRDMARRRPSSAAGFLQVHGVGQQKCEVYGERFLRCVCDYCSTHQIDMDVNVLPLRPPRRLDGLNASTLSSFEYFRTGLSVAEVASKMGRAVSTTTGYLTHFLRHEAITDPTPWVEPAIAARIRDAITKVGHESMRPIFEHLSEEVPYDQIRIVLTCYGNEAGEERNECL